MMAVNNNALALCVDLLNDGPKFSAERSELYVHATRFDMLPFAVSSSRIRF